METKYDIELKKWNKEVNEPFYQHLINNELQDWQSEGYVPVEHPTAKEATSLKVKIKKFLKETFI